MVSFPALLALAADPVASLFETSLLGNLGELPSWTDGRRPNRNVKAVELTVLDCLELDWPGAGGVA